MPSNRAINEVLGLEEILKVHLVCLPRPRQDKMETRAIELPGIIIIPSGFSTLRAEFLNL